MQYALCIIWRAKLPHDYWAWVFPQPLPPSPHSNRSPRSSPPPPPNWWEMAQPSASPRRPSCSLFAQCSWSNSIQLEEEKNKAVQCTVYRWDHICSRYLIFTLKFGFKKPGGIIKLCSQGPKGFKIIQLSSLLQKLELSFLLISLPAPGQADAGQCCPCPLLSNHRRGFLRLPCINACCLVNSSSV